MRTNAKQKQGFTLIELLVVIAIIAILASLLFPVFGRVREGVSQSNCMTNLHEIGVDVKLYFIDNGKYPPILMCNPYITNAAPPPAQQIYNGVGTPLNAQSVLSRSFAPSSGQRYNMDVGIFQCPDNVKNNNRSLVFHGAVFPQGTPIGGLPPAAAAKFDGETNPTSWYYNFDSYDTGPQLDMNGIPVVPAVQEIHYALDWTGAPIGTSDAQNQLKYPQAPEDKTVITWCTYHAAVAHSDQIMVLLLNGSAKATHYSKFVYKSPANPNGPLGFNP